eukprot:GDKH01002993.1.p2 GENE.GDKH01002993.1~~GDKH01002993.1.p2  ORF type:complete len:51 (+),score=1.14 GDKH01002993.1:1100-1252(+)
MPSLKEYINNITFKTRFNYNIIISLNIVLEGDILSLLTLGTELYIIKTKE